VSFTITNTLICEHVAVRVQTDHPRRGDLRITLRSPSGVRSVLQQVNFDNLAGPTDWTTTPPNFYEGSAGTWQVVVTMKTARCRADFVGRTDHPRRSHHRHRCGRLDDGWERRVSARSRSPKDDPDGDG